jgi:predicted HicB family RNase H-like nuclease
MYTNLQKKEEEEPKKRKFKKVERRTKMVRIDEEKHYWLKVDASWQKKTISELLSQIIAFFYKKKKRDLSEFEVE